MNASSPRPHGAARAKILEAAAGLFAARGYAATRTRDIAAAAGVNIALISYHFGGKAGLYDAALQRGVDAAREAIKSGGTAGSSPEERLVRAFASALTAVPTLPAMLMRELLSPDRLLAPETASILYGFMGLTRDMLEALPLDDEARGWDPQIVHLCVIAPLVHFLIATPMREAVAAKLDPPPTTPDLEQFITVQAALLRRALGTAPI